MKDLKFLALAVLFMFFYASVALAGYQDDDVSSGLENVQITNSVSRRAPKGAGSYVDEGGVFHSESMSEYVGRRLGELEKRIAVLENKQKDMEKAIEKLKETKK